MTRRISRIELLVVVVIATIAGVLSAYTQRSLRWRRGGHNRTKCANQLRQFGLAALQYGDDKRFLPHFSATAQLDGDVDGNHQTKAIRALLWYGYHDNPEGWICPESYDAYIPVNDPDTRDNMRRWFWSGETTQAKQAPSPWVDGADDPTLLETTELSYGWTRKSMSSNVSSVAVLGADRSVRRDDDDAEPLASIKPGTYGNHRDGWNVLKADGAIEFVTTDADLDGTGARVGVAWLRSTTPGGGYLAIADQKGLE